MLCYRTATVPAFVCSLLAKPALPSPDHAVVQNFACQMNTPIILHQAQNILNNTNMPDFLLFGCTLHLVPVQWKHQMTRWLVCSIGVQLKVHEPTVKLMQAHYTKTGKEVNEARLRMATLPEGAEVWSTTSSTLTAYDA